MNRSAWKWKRLMVGTLTLLAMASTAVADDHTISLAEGKITLQAPKAWVVKRPSSGIVEFEFAIPKAEGDDSDGRMTVMGAGGTIDANVARWLGQFRNAQGEPLDQTAAKIDKRQVANQPVVIVDISGTYIDKPGGPFAPGPAIERAGYRMLAGVVQTKGLGNYFFKFYGPEKTVAQHEKAFMQMIESLSVK